MKSKNFAGFHEELAELLTKHDIEGFVGIWFSDNTDHVGFVRGASQGVPYMRSVVERIYELMREWADDVYTSERWSGHVLSIKPKNQSKT